MLNPERKGFFMRKLRFLAGMLAFMLALGAAWGALGEYHRTGAGERAWWGVLCGDALLLARAEEGEKRPADETEVVFVWPLWEWLLRFLGLI